MFNTNLFSNTGSVSAPEEYLISAGQGSSFIKWSNSGSALVTRSILNGAGTAYGYALAKSSDRVFLGGWFTISLLPGGSPTNDIVKVNLSLVKDPAFSTNPAGGTNTSTGVSALALDGSGGIYVGGSFTTWNSVAANRIVKLGATGAKDTSFDNSTGFNGTVFALAVDSNGKIYCGGDFTTYKGTSANRIVRLNTDGSIDSGFVPTTNGSFVNTVRSIKIDSNGKIVVAGNFSRSLGGGAFDGYQISRFNTDGSFDTSWQRTLVNFGFIPVSQLEIDSNGKIYFCGDFTSLSASGGSPTYNYKYLARLNSDGTVDTGFDTTNKFNGIVNGISISPSSFGKIYCGGSFTTYDSQSYKYLIRLNTDASIDSTFNPGTTLPTGNYPIALLSYS